jgi:putative phosphoribosyl transferase
MESLETDIAIDVGPHRLHGSLAVPPGAESLVVFAHGSGSGRNSPRNRFVAQRLNQAGHATLLIDLLTEAEEERDRWTAAHRFDIPLLSLRLDGVRDWTRSELGTRGMALGFFGASTGAAAALSTAAGHPQDVQAVVCRGGRPDLAFSSLEGVRAPVLLLVGDRDPSVIDVNREALDRIRSEKDLFLVPGATHLFEEPGALDTVADLACGWFNRHLAPGRWRDGVWNAAHQRREPWLGHFGS